MPLKAPASASQPVVRQTKVQLPPAGTGHPQQPLSPACPEGLPGSALETHGLPQPSRLERKEREGRRTPVGQQGLLSPKQEKSVGFHKKQLPCLRGSRHHGGRCALCQFGV